jgi:hypothetical protein
MGELLLLGILCILIKALQAIRLLGGDAGKIAQDAIEKEKVAMDIYCDWKSEN